MLFRFALWRKRCWLRPSSSVRALTAETSRVVLEDGQRQGNANGVHRPVVTVSAPDLAQPAPSRCLRGWSFRAGTFSGDFATRSWLTPRHRTPVDLYGRRFLVLPICGRGERPDPHERTVRPRRAVPDPSLDAQPAHQQLGSGLIC